MYGLDINFLNDRPDYKPSEGRQTQRGPAVDQKPMLIGVGVFVGALGLVGGALLWLTQSNASLQENLTKLEQQQKEIDAKISEIENLKKDTARIIQETDALATVFNQIKPWSALYEELISRKPPGVQITSIKQVEPTAADLKLLYPSTSPSPQAAAASPSSSSSPSPAPSAAAPPPPSVAPPTATLSISGRANTFGEVNDFLLLLQRSPFLKNEETKLVTAALKDNPDQLLWSDSLKPSGNPPKLKKVVEYKIDTRLSDVGASELMADLKSKGAIGLVERIETLQQQGVIKQ